MQNKKIKFIQLMLLATPTLSFASNYQDNEVLEVKPDTITYKFADKDYSKQPIDSITIMANIAKTILDNTAYPTIAKKAPCSSWSSEEKCAIRTGTYITISKDKIIVEYQNVKNETGAITANLVESDIYNNLSFDLNVSVSQQESYIIAKLIVPNSVQINASNMSLTRYKPLDKPITLRDNLISIIQPNKIALSKYYVATGELDNQYSTDSVYGNLGRLMGKYEWSKFPRCDVIDKIMSRATDSKDISTLDIKSCKPDSNKLTEQQQKFFEDFMSKYDITAEQIPNTYRYKLNNVYIPVNIIAYPYRTQSKATYKAFIPYTMPSDGTMTLESTTVNTMIKSIESAVNN